MDAVTKTNVCPTCGSHVENPFLVSLETNTILINGNIVELSPDQAVIAKVIVDRYPSVVSRDALISAIWGYVNEPKDPKRCLAVKISELRARLDHTGYTILNVREAGLTIGRQTAPRAPKRSVCWTAEEEELVQNLLKGGKTCKEMGPLLPKRSLGAIYAKTKKWRSE